MTTEKDSRLVDYLYGELSEDEAKAFERELEADGALSSELAGLEETLETLRTVEAEEPPLHLDSLILANARKAADELAVEESKRGVRGWLRKTFASPLAGLVAAASVAVVAALVTVPTMMLTTSEEAPQSIERVPAPTSIVVETARQPVGGAAIDEDSAAADSTDEAPVDDLVRPAKEPAQPRSPKKKSKPARSAAANQEPRNDAKIESKVEEKDLEEKKGKDLGADGKARAIFDYRGDEGSEAGKKLGAAAGPPAPPVQPATPKAATPKPATRPLPSPEPAPEVGGSDDSVRLSRKEPDAPLEKSKKAEAGSEPAEMPPSVATASDPQTIVEEETVTKADRGERRRTPAKEAAREQAVREDRARTLLLAASAEFKRHNPESGRRILMRALSVAGDAPIHAEIAFRLAQHDFERGAYGEAVGYARIAAAEPKFSHRKAALELIVAAEKKVAQQKADDGMMLESAPAAAPPADMDEKAR